MPSKSLRAFMPFLRIAPVVLLLGLLSGRVASADRRYFTYTYSPFLSPAGEFEIESWLTARTGKADPGAGTAWDPRVAFEYGIHDRFSAAAYLNFEKSPHDNFQFHSPSLELIYRFARDGRLAGDPAIYLEATESREALELEPKLLLEQRRGPWISGINLIGELGVRHHDDEVLPSGTVLKHELAGEISSGVGYELNPHVAVSLESRFRSIHPNFGRQSAALLSLGPSVSLKFGEAQFALGILPQIWGSPRTNGSRNLDEFEKVQVRFVMGIEL